MIGERLADLRKDRGLTQQELADILNLTKYNISAYERDYNEAPDNVKIALATFFNVSVDYLLGLTDRPNPYEPPGSRIPHDKELPQNVKDVIQCIARLIALANSVNPQYVSDEINRMVEELLSEQRLREKTSSKADSSTS